MVQFSRLREEVARAYDRHGVKYYAMHTDEPAGFLEVEVRGVSMEFNVKHSTLMISSRNMSHPRAIPFKRWRENLDVTRLGIDRNWWRHFRGPILESLDLIDAQTVEPPAAVEDPDAQRDAPHDDYQPPATPPADDLFQFQTVVTVTMREGAHAATF